MVETIWSLFGRAEVDLFASEELRHCPLWFSWTAVTSPMGQDALAHDWPDILLYAFPPLGNTRAIGVAQWPKVAFLSKVLPLAHSNRPIQLACINIPQESGTPELLCPVRALGAYVDATACIRQSEQLFVCHGGTRKACALSKQRLSHWVVDTIAHASGTSGRPLPSGVRCHSRSVSTSWAALRGVPLETICAAASWASSGTFFRFYRVNVATPHPLGVVLFLSSAASS